MTEVVGKEAHFFNFPERVARGLGAYARLYSRCNPDRVFFDATPSYGLYNSDTILQMYGPERIRRSTFVAVLADPLVRTQSAFYYFHHWSSHAAWYWHSVSSDWPITKASFANVSNAFRNVSDIDGSTFASVFEMSRYIDFMPQMLDSIGSLVIIPTSHYLADSSGTPIMRALLDHERMRSGCTGPLSAWTNHVSPEAVHKMPPGSVEHISLSDEAFSPSTASLLREYFLPMIDKTYRFASTDARVVLLLSPQGSAHWLQNSTILLHSTAA